MDVLDFYQLIDSEISSLIIAYKSNPYLSRLKPPENKKSFAFLLWFLKRYSPNLKNIESYITEGDGDSSCDIIFSNEDHYGKKVYYIVQSKWHSKTNLKGTKGVSTEIKACLDDFKLILTGEKEKSLQNPNFNKKYAELLKHIEKNGAVKFIFLLLSTYGKELENIKEFRKNSAPFEIIDINRLKRDFIEVEYKGARTHNPIETPYEPKGEIEIEYLKNNTITVTNPFKSHIFLIRPKLIHTLFRKYGFALFYKNIRNPLSNSNFNPAISKTIKDNSKYFWYFNNGITAISDNINPIRSGTKVTVNGLQIINGAQTVYSIFSTYDEASSTERRKIDSSTQITLRLLESGGKDFDLNVTRYTNSQNPVNERDFHANDDIQLRLQKDFFDFTDVWYERRRGEFRTKLKNVEIVTNEYFAQTYLAYTLKDPVNAKNKSKLLFISDKVETDGLYEKVFHSKVKYDDMLVSYYLYEYIEAKRKAISQKIKVIELKDKNNYNSDDQIALEDEFLLHASFHILTILHILFLNENDSRSINGKVINSYKKNNLSIVDKPYNTAVTKIRKHLTKEAQGDPRFSLTRYFKTAASLDLLQLF
jgi:hypothetical protein